MASKRPRYYEILEVPQDTTPVQVKKAYRKLAMAYHPDKAHGDAKKMKELNEAYTTLSNEIERTTYDGELEAEAEAQAAAARLGKAVCWHRYVRQRGRVRVLTTRWAARTVAKVVARQRTRSGVGRVRKRAHGMRHAAWQTAGAA